MTTEKQTKTNKENALVSTGPKTAQGKLTVSKNAVKHGIFTQDLIIQAGDGKEDIKTYQELLDNLIQCLNPTDQMQHLLVEKIAVDFWRLKRLLRFETGSIRQYLDWAILDYYRSDDDDSWSFRKKEVKTNTQIDEEIKLKKHYIDWNTAYMKCLKKCTVKFDKPNWEGAGLESEIEDDLARLIDNCIIDDIDDRSKQSYEDGQMTFDEMRSLLAEHGYSTDKEISQALIKLFENDNSDYASEIITLEIEKKRNQFREEVILRTGMIPSEDTTDKIMRYERSLQKSIFQNIAMLKRLQEPIG